MADPFTLMPSSHIKSTLTNKADNQQLKGLFGGLIGVAVIVVLQLLSLPALTIGLTFSLYNFAISIPLLSLLLQSQIEETNRKHRPDAPWFIFLAAFVGLLTWFVGLAGIFFYLSSGAGAVFVGTSLLAVIGSAAHKILLDSVNRK